MAKFVKHGKVEDTKADGARWRNWAREQSCSPAAIVRPATREGLVAAVIKAAADGGKVKVAGSGHSFTDAALTDGIMLRLEGLDRVLDFDRSSGRVKVEAGIVLRPLNRRLDELGVAMANLGDIDHQTLAGSISTGTHGTGARFQNVSAQIAAIELVTADGTTLELSANSDPDAFRAARVGIGALGAIYSVTLETVPAYTLNRVDRARPLAQTLYGLDELTSSLDHFEFYVFPHTDIAVCRETHRTGEEPKPRHPARVFAQEMVLENGVGAAFSGLARQFPQMGPWLARRASATVSNETKIDKSYKVFASQRHIKFTEMEYAIPRQRAREAIERVVKIASRPEHQVAWPIEVRFVAADDALLSPSHERDTCYIAVHQDRKLDWESYFREVEAVLGAMEGRPHWGKRHFMRADSLSQRYPRWADFQAVRKRLDPEGAFSNSYTERVLGPVA